ncbi:DUF7800 domain-containing protein, partial [Streptomyces anulatus]
MTGLRLGPLLRYVDWESGSTATVWVEASRGGTPGGPGPGGGAGGARPRRARKNKKHPPQQTTK